jgi:transcriptional regulator with XRE-family HTH domain
MEMGCVELSVDESLRLMSETYVIVNGTMLRQCRTKRGLTQAALARMAGTTQANINRLERGQCRTRHATLRSLAEALDVRVQVLTRLPERRRAGITREGEDGS